MAYTFKKRLANKANYGHKRLLSRIKYIVIHYTANDGDSDEGNGNYFANQIVEASAHYFVDGDSITQSVPDDYIAYSVGDSKYSNCNKTGGGKLYGQCTNLNTISIELCDEVKNGISDFSPATIENAVELVRELMKKYDVDINHVIRHFDVTGKPCPLPYVDNIRWLGFKKKIIESEDLTVSQYEELKKEIEALKAKNKALESIVGSLYKTEDEIPDYYIEAIKPLIDKGAIKGTGENELNLPEIIARVLVIINRDKNA